MRRLAVFARAPLEGHVKRRLSPALPARLAAMLYAGMLGDTIDALLRSTADERLLYWDGAPAEIPYELHSRAQVPGDPGTRLAAAFDDLIFAPGDHALLVASDVPGMTPAHVDAAFAVLERHDVVLGPSRDGGFWCVGLTWKDPEIFRDIPWGTPEAMYQVAARAHATNRHVAYADWLDDLDTPSQLAQLCGLVAAGQPACGPRMHAALQGAGLAPAWNAPPLSPEERQRREWA